MNANRLVWLILFLLGAMCVRADIFDQVATNNPSTTNVQNIPSPPPGFVLDKVLLATNLMSTHVDSVPENSMEALMAKAEKGDVIAEYNLGTLYHAGHGVTKNDTEAIKWFGKAANQGNSDAASCLGTMYSLGVGIEADQVEANKGI